MSDSFDKWYKSIYPTILDEQGYEYAEKAYLAGQSSAEQRVKEKDRALDDIGKAYGWLHDKCVELERERDYWKEEARRYASNADAWRDKAQAGEPSPYALQCRPEQECFRCGKHATSTPAAERRESDMYRSKFVPVKESK